MKESKESAQQDILDIQTAEDAESLVKKFEEDYKRFNYGENPQAMEYWFSVVGELKDRATELRKEYELLLKKTRKEGWTPQDKERDKILRDLTHYLVRLCAAIYGPAERVHGKKWMEILKLKPDPPDY